MTSRRHLSPARALTATSKQIEDEMVLINEERKIVVSDSSLLERAVNDCFEDLLDSVILGFAFEMHRNLKVGLCEYDNIVPRNIGQGVVDEPGLDIFGLPPLKKPPDCTCPHCKRRLTAVRFAPHLEKCRGFGRNSSRISQRQIGNASNSESMKANVAEDTDWVQKGKNGKKKERASTKHIKNTKLPKNGNTTHAEGSAPDIVTGDISVNYDNMNYEDRKNFLVHSCGVISKHTHDLCVQSLQCPQHTDDQRQAVRMNLFNSEVSAEGSVSFEQVDVDTYEEGDGQNMRDELGRHWEEERLKMSSPIIPHHSGKKRDKFKLKKKSSKKASRHSYDD